MKTVQTDRRDPVKDDRYRLVEGTAQRGWKLQ